MYVAPAAMHMRLLLRSSTPLSFPHKLALAADVALIGYGAIGQMVAGTLVTYRATRKRQETESERE